MGKKRLPNVGSSELKKSVAASVPMEQQLEGLRSRFEDNVETSFGLRNRLTSGASSAVAQQFRNVGGGPRSFASNLEQTIRRGKARTGIINRGEKAIANQKLKDRIGIARQRIGRKGILEDALGNAANIRAGVDDARRNAKDQVSAAFGGAAGSILGGLASGFGSKLFKGSGVPVQTDLGTASADFQNMNFHNTGFDFDNIGQGIGGPALV